MLVSRTPPANGLRGPNLTEDRAPMALKLLPPSFCSDANRLGPAVSSSPVSKISTEADRLRNTLRFGQRLQVCFYKAGLMIGQVLRVL
jgi:hypothetical protein